MENSVQFIEKTRTQVALELHERWGFMRGYSRDSVEFLFTVDEWATENDPVGVTQREYDALGHICKFCSENKVLFRAESRRDNNGTIIFSAYVERLLMGERLCAESEWGESVVSQLLAVLNGILLVDAQEE